MFRPLVLLELEFEPKLLYSIAGAAVSIGDFMWRGEQTNHGMADHPCGAAMHTPTHACLTSHAQTDKDLV